MKGLLQVLVLTLWCASALAQIPVGSIVKLTSPSGRRLNALPGQGLSASATAFGGYDEWQVASDTLTSYIGTNLTISWTGTMKAIHAPRMPGDEIVLSGVAEGASGKPLVSDGKVVLYSANKYTSGFYALQDTNGAITLRSISSLQAIPP